MRHTTDTCIETYTGLYLDYLDPRPEQIDVTDIARALSQTCRFAGQTSDYYSVAEHAVRVMAHLSRPYEDPLLRLAALHHDSHEAYIGDWPSPLKAVFDSDLYRQITREIDRAVAEKFGFELALFSDRRIKDADEIVLRREAATLKQSRGIGRHWAWDDPLTKLAGVGWSPHEAERQFLKAHVRLINAQ